MKKVCLMIASKMRLWNAIALVMALIGLMGCSPMVASQEGIDVMFEGNPRIYKQDVYYRGQVIGQILNQEEGNGSVYKVSIRLVPEYDKEAGKHWVFYADNGGLNASKISAGGQPLTKGDKICGFSSKAALNWFKLKTLLSDRVYKANQIAGALSRRFG